MPVTRAYAKMPLKIFHSTRKLAGRVSRKGGAMSRKKAKMLFWAALVVLAYIPYLMQSAGPAVL